jgi:hypothetical protein
MVPSRHAKKALDMKRTSTSRWTEEARTPNNGDALQRIGLIVRRCDKNWRGASLLWDRLPQPILQGIHCAFI